MTIGRNDACPCGSGKKYKKCCMLPARESASPTSLMKERLDRFHEHIVDRLFRHGKKVFGQEAFAEALLEFFAWPTEDEQEEMSLEGLEQLFYPWFLFKWRVDSDDDESTLACPRDLSIAESYLRSTEGKKLAALEREYVEAYIRAELSFFEVADVVAGESLTLLDLLLDQEHLVLEQGASSVLRRGDVLFGQVVEAGGIAILGATSAIPLSPSAKVGILAMREKMAAGPAGAGGITPETLYSYDIELRMLYLDLFQASIAMPSLCNTDGEKLSFHTLKYAIASPQKAFDALKGLTGGYVSRKELLKEAEFDGQGRLRTVDIPWLEKANTKHGGMENTLLGHIRINGEELECEVNSAERAARLRAIIEERLSPEEARHRATVVRSTEAMMREQQDAPDADSSPSHEELMALPEVRAQLDEMMRKHWEAWVDMELPALGGRTPRQAAGDSLGRRQVAALLEDAERRCLDSDGSMGSVEYIRNIRRELGIDRG